MQRTPGFWIGFLTLLVALSSPAQAISGDAAVRAIPSDAETLEVEFHLPALQIESVEIAGAAYDLLAIEGGGIQGHGMEPLLPTYSRLIRLPARMRAEIEIVAVESEVRAGCRPLPAAFVADMDPPAGPEADQDRVLAVGPGAGPVGTQDPDRSAAEWAWARCGEPAIARGVRVVPITFFPVRATGADGEVEVASRIAVTVRFVGGSPLARAETATRLIAPSFTDLHRHLTVNPPVDALSDPRRPAGSAAEGTDAGSLVRLGLGDRPAAGHPSLGSYLLICPDDPAVVAALEPLVEWRTRQGFSVHLATTAETGTTRDAIKAWIQNAYDDWEEPPEYISLVGDHDGAIAIPTWFENWSGYHGEGDLPYVQLDGDDVLADAHIGRISVDSVERLQLYVTKIVGYESTPYMADTDWYVRACLVGDPSASGYTCVQIMQWHKERLLEWGYVEVDTVFAGPWVSQMLERLNRGDSVFSYRGFGGMSGFDVGDILSLQNGWKMPFAVNLTCLTGSFASGTARSEAWIRAGLPPSVPTGGIASIGTATGGTHTRYNNCITYGIWRAPFWEEQYRFGQALTRGKYELFLNYQVQDPNNVRTFSHWNNLMGDAAGELWTAIPHPLVVDHTAQLALGANAVTVDCAANGGPCPGAYVCLWREGETHVGDYTGADGRVTLPIEVATAGELAVTVTKHDHHPYLGVIDIQPAELFVGYRDHAIDDDMVETSNGNADGLPNPTETIELPVEVENFGTTGADSVHGRLTCDDPYVMILDAEEEFGAVAAGETVWSADDFDIAIDGGAPDGHLIPLDLELAAGRSLWQSRFEIEITAAAFEYAGIELYGFGGGIDPGEEGEISVTLTNAGGAAGEDIAGTLVSQSPWLEVSDDQGGFGTIAAGEEGANEGDRFALVAAPGCFPGHLASMVLLLTFSGGARDTVAFVLPVGEAAGDDPTGPDGYGYYAFDNTDTAYEEAPVYEWVEIAPNHGGSGSPVGLTDFGWEQDDSRVVTLPFPFTYYGVTYHEATICSNGWLALGPTYLTNYRNWIIPGAGAPANLIAPMWDNLYQSGDDQVYHWYDEAQHRYIVQWSRLRNNAGGLPENFELILYDESEHPTATGDGLIVFQYDTFNNSDSGQHYSTIGIENEDRSDGLMYGYYNYYNSAATSISSGRAIKFVAISDSTWGLLAGTIINETNGGSGLEGATVTLLEAEQVLESGADGTYGGSVPAGIYTLVADHPSFAADTLSGVTILSGGLTTQDFALVDVVGPWFYNTTELPSTSNTLGPYEVTSTIGDESALGELLLRHRVLGGDWAEIPLAAIGEDTYGAGIPGQPLGSLVFYYLQASDAGENIGVDPPGAPEEAYWFWVHEAEFSDDMEGGSGQWDHYVVTNGYVDQWHRSSQRNHTPGGSWSWKCGDTGGGPYARLGDGALQTEPFFLDGSTATLRFWHWIDGEVFWHDSLMAFDGGLVEMAVDGGVWAPIHPEGGYRYRLMEWQGGSPFPQGTWLYSGTHDWSQAEFRISEVVGDVQIRFRFGTDNLEVTAHTGWYIDDVEIVMPGEHPSDAQELEVYPALALHPPAPNPLAGRSAGAQIRFDLPHPAHARLQIADVTGRRMCVLLDASVEAGTHARIWAAHGPHGLPLPSGVYYCILEIEGERRTQAVTVVR